MKKIQLFSLLALLPALVFAQAPTPVFVTSVQKINFVDEIEALGTLSANEHVDLTSSVTERITAIHFDSGQRVSKEKRLLEMNTAEQAALLAQEKAVMNEAQRQIERLQPLMERGAASQSAMDNAVLNLESAKARIAAIESRIQERHIVAPFDGKLGLRNISVGAMAQPGTLITTIDDDKIMKLDFSIPELFLSSIKEDGKINANTRSYPDNTFQGRVASIDSRVDPVTRAVRVRALLDNADYLLRPGMLMSVRLERNPRQALVIPEESIVPRGNKNFVYIINNEQQATVSLVEVTLGSRRKGEVEIIQGLEQGMQVVTHGTLRLQNGDNVLVKAATEERQPLNKMLKQDSTKGE